MRRQPQYEKNGQLGLKSHFRSGIFKEDRSFADVLAKSGKGAVTGLGHNGALGHAGGGGLGSKAGAQRVSGIVAGDAGFRDQLFDHQGYGLWSQAGWVDTSVPVDRAEQRSFSNLEDLGPSFHRPHWAGGRCQAVRNPDLPSLPFRVGF
jgi:hypothetical protein